jgi:hypothetical protein
MKRQLFCPATGVIILWNKKLNPDINNAIIFGREGEKLILKNNIVPYRSRE